MSAYPRTIAAATFLTQHASKIEPILIATQAAWPAVVAACVPIKDAVVAAMPPQVSVAMRGAMLMFGGV